MSDFDQERLFTLINKCLENEADDKEFAELSQILKDSKEAQIAYLEMVELHTALDDKSFSKILKSNSPQKKPQRKSSGSFKVLPIAALLALFFGVFYGLRPQESFKVIVSDSQDALLQGQSVEHGQEITDNLISLQRGLLSLEFSTGAKMVIEGPAKVEILSENSTRLFSGKIFAYVPPQAKGFSVEVGSRKVIDLGTSFALEVNGEQELHVFDGLVELQEDLENRIEVQEGKALKFSKDAYPQKIKLDQEKFASLKSFMFPAKTFHFEKGLEGWTQSKTGKFFDRGDKKANTQTQGNMRFAQTKKSVLSNENSFGKNLCNAHKFAGRVVPMPFYARDSSKQVLVLSSPPFSLRKNGGDIQAFLHGGCGAVEELTGTLNGLGNNAHENGFLGLALRRVSDNKYVASVRRKARNRPQFRQGWEKVIISAKEINRILSESDNGETFVLDLVDAYAYEDAIWSWAALDTVTIPGKFNIKEKK